jgi:hypothetical protein
VFIK